MQEPLTWKAHVIPVNFRLGINKIPEQTQADVLLMYSSIMRGETSGLVQARVSGESELDNMRTPPGKSKQALG